MDTILRTLLDIRGLKFRHDDDLPDRLNRQYTCGLLTIFAAVVSARQYWGDAIHCWCPEQCAGNHEKYANMYCWISDTYYLAFEDDMLQPYEERTRKIVYYQWTPVILMTQAAMFFLPCTLWRVLSRRSGLNLGVIMEAAVSSQGTVYSEAREKTLRYAVLILDRHLLHQRDHGTGTAARIRHALSRHCLFFCGKLHGNYLTVCYLCIKVVYVINAVGQLFFLDVLLGYNYHLFGIHVLRHFLYGEEWLASEKFPRVTMCDFRVRQNTNVQQYTVQCVLPINLFNEIIFTIIWFVFLAISLTTTLSFLQWLARSLYWPAQVRHVRRQLRVVEAVHCDTNQMKKFTENYLRRDGMFILRLVAKNAGDLVATEMLWGLWDNYGPKHSQLTEAPGKRVKVSRGRASRSAPLPPNAVSAETHRMEIV